MNAPERMPLPDIQSSPDLRNIAINRVGIKGLRFPVRIRSATGAEHHTVATFEMTVGLPPHVKGTHMSRFVEMLERQDVALDFEHVQALLEGTLERLEADSGQIVMRFPYFIRKKAPVSGVESLMDYDVTLRASSDIQNGYRYEIAVCVAATSLCPCSKEISDYGAHNQRSHITITAEIDAPMSIEELVRIAEDEASCEVYGLLKRPDEKFVTERAYDNPKFVEDLVRDVAARLNANPRILRYTLEAENFESIHNHSAYAVIENDKRAGN